MSATGDNYHGLPHTSILSNLSRRLLRHHRRRTLRHAPLGTWLLHLDPLQSHIRVADPPQSHIRVRDPEALAAKSDTTEHAAAVAAAVAPELVRGRCGCGDGRLPAAVAVFARVAFATGGGGGEGGSQEGHGKEARAYTRDPTGRTLTPF